MAGTLGTITYTIYPASAIFKAYYYSGNESYDFSFTQSDCIVVNDHLVYTSQNTYYEGTSLFVAYNHNFEYTNQISDALTVYLPDCTLYAWQGSGGINYIQKAEYNILLQPEELFGWTDEIQTETLYAWDVETLSSESPFTLYTKTATPTTDTPLYDYTGTLVTDYTITAVTENGITIEEAGYVVSFVKDSSVSSYTINNITYTSNTTVHLSEGNYTISAITSAHVVSISSGGQYTTSFGSPSSNTKTGTLIVNSSGGISIDGYNLGSAPLTLTMVGSSSGGSN